MALRELLRKAASTLPLIGPDADYEADLLLAGVKPIGRFTNFIPDPHVNYCADGVMTQIRNDIARLDAAVSLGALEKTVVVVRNESIEPDFTLHHHYYCQPGMRDRMMILAQSQHSSSSEMTVNEGRYFGYPLADRLLWRFGGYERMPPGVRQMLQATHEYRKQCRLYARLGTSEVPPEASP